jgi:CAAX protease family protein
MGLDPVAKRRALVFLAVAGAVLWIPFARALIGRPPLFLRGLGFGSGPGGTPLAWVLGLALGTGYAVFSVRNIPLVRDHWCAPSLAKLLALVAAVAAAVVEEAFFRRLVMDAVRSAGGDALVQVAASALSFGLAHALWGVGARSFEVADRVMLVTGTFGVGLAVVYLLGHRSLAPVVAAHFVVAAVIQPGILYAAFSGPLTGPGRR